MYSLVFYVPTSALYKVKRALFLAGAGKQGAYSDCCWQVKGMGEFVSSLSANPAVGDPGEHNTVEEYRVEMRVSEECKDACIAALKLSHPYEEPTYSLTILESWR